MSIWFLYDALFLLTGCYGIGLAMKVKQSGDLADMKKLLPKYAHPNRCKDAKGFIDRTVPMLLLFSAVTVLNGLLGMLEDLELVSSDWLHMGAIVLFFAVAVLFLVVERRAIRQYWGDDDQPDQVRAQVKKEERARKRARKGK